MGVTIIIDHQYLMVIVKLTSMHHLISSRSILAFFSTALFSFQRRTMDEQAWFKNALSNKLARVCWYLTLSVDSLYVHLFITVMGLPGLVNRYLELGNVHWLKWAFFTICSFIVPLIGVCNAKSFMSRRVAIGEFCRGNLAIHHRVSGIKRFRNMQIVLLLTAVSFCILATALITFILLFAFILRDTAYIWNHIVWGTYFYYAYLMIARFCILISISGASFHTMTASMNDICDLDEVKVTEYIKYYSTLVNNTKSISEHYRSNNLLNIAFVFLNLLSITFFFSTEDLEWMRGYSWLMDFTVVYCLLQYGTVVFLIASCTINDSEVSITKFYFGLQNFYRRF